jgi:hypothetical protein
MFYEYFSEKFVLEIQAFAVVNKWTGKIGSLFIIMKLVVGIVCI